MANCTVSSHIDTYCQVPSSLTPPNSQYNPFSILHSLAFLQPLHSFLFYHNFYYLLLFLILFSLFYIQLSLIHTSFLPSHYPFYIYYLSPLITSYFILYFPLHYRLFSWPFSEKYLLIEDSVSSNTIQNYEYY